MHYFIRGNNIHTLVPERPSTLRALGELRVALDANILVSGDHTNRRTPDDPVGMRRR